MAETKIAPDQERAVPGTPTNRLVVVNHVAGIGSTLPTFVLPAGFNPTESDPIHNLEVSRNGLLQSNGDDYTYDVPSKTVTFVTASIPQTGDIVQFVSFQ